MLTDLGVRGTVPHLSLICHVASEKASKSHETLLAHLFNEHPGDPGSALAEGSECFPSTTEDGQPSHPYSVMLPLNSLAPPSTGPAAAPVQSSSNHP